MLDKIFEPVNIGKLKIDNRIVMAPMATHFANRDGFVTERLKNYYIERARSGIGLIILYLAMSFPTQAAVNLHKTSKSRDIWYFANYFRNNHVRRYLPSGEQ
jgi:2,4-dienoyl-CoA reductase-like NADH-dependent reductase (Old Yellow Enzyme family)